MNQKIREARDFVLSRCGQECPVGVILGSGLGGFAEAVEGAVEIPFSEIPHFPHSSVVGHAGKLRVGTLHGRRVAVMQGRVHYYEGHAPEDVIFPARVLRSLGVQTLMVTNAAGGVNTVFRAGDLMLIRDHINFLGFNPLRGANDEEMGPRFPDMSYAYAPALRKLAQEVAAEKNIGLREGVYVAVSGPSYETPAEIRMFRAWGADAVGMSTVPEVIAANHMGMKVLGISCITNMAAGILDQPLTHTEVMETTARVTRDFVSLLDGVVARL